MLTIKRKLSIFVRFFCSQKQKQKLELEHEREERRGEDHRSMLQSSKSGGGSFEPSAILRHQRHAAVVRKIERTKERRDGQRERQINETVG